MERWRFGLCGIALVVFIAFPIGCSRPTAREATESPKPAAAAAAAQRVAPDPAAVDACSLLTAEEVGAALGKPVTVVPLTTGQASDCEYFDEKQRTDKLAAMVVYTVTPSQAKGAFEATKGGGRDQVAVSGIGDDAYWDSLMGLVVLKGRYEFSVSVLERGVDRPKVARALASKLLSRLP
jgi:hypothetical protein